MHLIQRLSLGVLAALIAAWSGPAAAQACRAKIEPGTQNVYEATVLGGVRTPTVVTLNGNPSKGDSFSWTQTSGPTVSLVGANGQSPSFTAPDVGPDGATLAFELTVVGCGGRFTERAIVNVLDVRPANTGPTASAVASPAAPQEGATVQLDGRGSTDPENDVLFFQWEQLTGPEVTLVDPLEAVASFTAPDVGPAGATLTFRLIVSDGALTSTTTINVNVVWVNLPPTAVAVCPADVDERAPFTLNGAGSSDLDDGIVSWVWSQPTSGPKADLLGQAPGQPSFTLNAPTLRPGDTDPMEFMLTVTDASGREATDTCTVYVNDVTPPDLRLPASPLPAEASSKDGATVSFSVFAIDAYEGDVPVTCVPASGALFPLGDTTVECNAADGAGNAATASFVVRVQDTTPPTLVVPTDLTEEATGPDGAAVTFTASALDVVDGAVTPVCTPASGSTFALGATTVTCTATDDAGNDASDSFTVTVVDTTPPAISVPAGITQEATGPSGASVTYGASANDLVDGAVTPVCTPASGSTFALGATTVTCTATDKAGNAASDSFTVTVVDTTPPAVTVPSNITLEATGPAGAIATFSASANDLVDGAVTPVCTPASGSTFALGATTVTCTATDKAGNAASDSFTVTVVDTTPPALSLPASFTVPASALDGATVNYSASATDLVDGSVSPVCVPASNTKFAPGQTTVTCTATDRAGNSASGSFTVTVLFRFDGFFQPIDNLPALNTVKGGSTVPVKWRLFAGNVEITDVAAVRARTATQVPCVGAGAEAPVEFVTSGGTTLRYDTLGAQFVFNWQTPRQPGICVRLDVTFTDGQTKSANFKLK